MEFKDKLKQLRQEKGISQQELARAIYVSRSAVAKWENGLGIPNQDSYRALLDHFSVSREELPLNEERESLSVAKNEKIRTLSAAVMILSLAIAAMAVLLFFYAFRHGYGFTSEMAVGQNWRREPYLSTGDYDFYYSCIEGDGIKAIDAFAVTEKKFVGYQKILDLEGHKKTVYDEAQQPFGYVYSFRGRQKVHHIFISTKTAYADKGVQINLLSEIRIKEETLPVLYNGYFETNDALTGFFANGCFYTVA